MEKTFQSQCYDADKILKNKLKVWFDKMKQFAPFYVCEYLFHKNGAVAQMLQVDPNYGFIYDPATLGEGIENMFAVVEAAKKGNITRARNLYKRFATPEIRVDYLRLIYDYCDIYHAIGEDIIADLDEYAKTCTDPEFFEVLEGRKNNIRGRAKIEQKHITEGGFGMH